MEYLTFLAMYKGPYMTSDIRYFIDHLMNHGDGAIKDRTIDAMLKNVTQE